MVQQSLLHYGDFKEHPCAICAEPAYIRINPPGAADPPRYFCADHLTEAQALRDYLLRQSRGY